MNAITFTFDERSVGLTSGGVRVEPLHDIKRPEDLSNQAWSELAEDVCKRLNAAGLPERLTQASVPVDLQDRFEEGYCTFHNVHTGLNTSPAALRKLRGEHGDYREYAFLHGCWIGYKLREEEHERESQ